MSEPIAHHIVCHSCGYCLTGLAHDAVCPECGTPSSQSIVSDSIYLQQPAYIRRIALGMAIVFWASSTFFLLIVCTITMIIVLPSSATASMNTIVIGAFVAPVICVVCWTAGWFIATPPYRPRCESPDSARLRWTIRIAACCMLLIPVILLAPTTLQALAALGLSLTVYLAFVYFAAMAYIRSIALRIPSPAVAAKAKAAGPSGRFAFALIGIGILSSYLLGILINSNFTIWLMVGIFFWGTLAFLVAGTIMACANWFSVTLRFAKTMREARRRSDALGKASHTP